MALTKTQVKKAMQSAGIEGELTGKGQEWEVELANEEIANLFCEKVTSEVGGYKTGYGAYVYRPNYRVDEFDFNCTASRDHY